MDFEPSARTKDYLERVQRFMSEHIEPVEARYWEEVRATNPTGDWRTWKVHPLMEELKAAARAEGLWNLFLPDPKLGAGLSHARVRADRRGDGPQLPRARGLQLQRARHRQHGGPLEVRLRGAEGSAGSRRCSPGEIRSVFCMTEPDVASSDATNMQATAIVEGDEVVLNGKKWWSSGVGDPRAKVAIFMARTPDARRGPPPSALDGARAARRARRRDPAHAAGVRRLRRAARPRRGALRERARAARRTSSPGLGWGFEIAQGRLGPGRIHHCMRCIGAAERALELMIDRGMQRTAFGKPLLNLGGNRERVAEARIAIDQARLLTLYAAWKLDEVGALGAMTEISAIKVVAPNVLQKVVDDAIQIHGGAGVSHDTPLTGFFAQARSLRLADGPDEVHKGLIARIELAKRGFSRKE